MSYSYQIRCRVLEYAEKVGNVREAAARYGVAAKTIYEWRKLGDNLGEIGKPGRKKNTKIDEAKLRAAISDGTEIMQKELAEQFGVSRSGMCRALKRLKISRKKNVDIR